MHKKYPKIVLIGAGSAVFSKVLLSDIFSFSSLRNAEIILVDIDSEKLNFTYKLAKKLSVNIEFNGKIKKFLNRRDALKNADFIINMISVGGNDAWEVDRNIPLKYGVDQIIGDCLNPGGLFRALRNIPEIINLCRDIEKLCPSNSYQL